MVSKTKVLQALDEAVAKIGGQRREGQTKMAQAVSDCLDDQCHLIVQAGTGTGKSLGYLIPAGMWALENSKTVVIATATLALQTQLANKDIPMAAAAIKKVTNKKPEVAVLKGRSNYACVYKTCDQVADEQEGLFSNEELAQSAAKTNVSESGVGQQVLKLREWVDSQIAEDGDGDRDDAPSHNLLAWQQVSTTARECVGASSCKYGDICFAEAAKGRASKSDIVVTNHALLAVDAMHENNSLPSYDAVIIDEAHELANRITGAATDELSDNAVKRAAKRCAGWLDDDLNAEIIDEIELFKKAMDEKEEGQITNGQAELIVHCARIADLMRQVTSVLAKEKDQNDPKRTQASLLANEILKIAERIAVLSASNVVWLAKNEKFGNHLSVAPLDVAGLMREKILAKTPTILTSATLKIGGNFNSVASTIGFRKAEQIDLDLSEQLADSQDLDAGSAKQKNNLAWKSMDVGSPFDYQKQGILYIASQLPRPGKGGLTEEALIEISKLIRASNGKALGLFASQRSAELAAEYVRKELPEQIIMCQGEAQLAELTRRFTQELNSTLFGTLSLWQGIDVPGQTCQLVMIEKIPFPRPDDPLMQARQRAVDQRGGNGFMNVAATHAGLLLAQGAGRLIRRNDDRGVVALLDSRIATARYGSFLLASLPNFWVTKNQDIACSALSRLAKR